MTNSTASSSNLEYRARTDDDGIPVPVPPGEDPPPPIQEPPDKPISQPDSPVGEPDPPGPRKL